MPTNPNESEALAHQEAIAEFGINTRGSGPSGMVEEGHESFSAAIGNLDKGSSVTSIRVLGAEDIEVRRKLYCTVVVARSPIKVDDDPVVRILRIDLEVHFADEPFIGAGKSEGFSAGDVGAGLDFDS